MSALNARNLTIMAIMILAAALAFIIQPNKRLADMSDDVNLESMIPQSFGDWEHAQDIGAAVVNPQQQEVLNKIYTQTLSRTYRNSKGEFIMLSIAYGEDQSDSKQLHLPDVCYPAQGFQLKAKAKGVLHTDFGDIRVKRLDAFKGNRIEPLTYWTTVGNHVVLGGLENKLAQLDYGFKGFIPDGLIFRVSNIDSDSNAAYSIQSVFVNDLLKAVNSETRSKLSGL